MIHVGSYLKIMDNSGAKEVQCIRVVGSSKKKSAGVGNFILVSVKSSTAKQKSRIKSGKVYDALMVHSKKNTRRKDGGTISSGKNIAVLLNANGMPFCTRFFANMSYEIRAQGALKLLSTSKYLY